MPYARRVHVKAYDFAGDGSHPCFDILKCLDVVKGSGYQGALWVEFEGKQHPHQGTAHALAVCRQHLRTS